MFPNNSDVVSLQQGYGVLIGTVIIFNILNRIVTFIGVPAVVIHYAINKEEEKWKWRNLVLSWIHAFFVGVWNISCFWFYPELWEDPVSHITPYTYFMLAFSTGYFIYDFSDVIMHKQMFKLWELSLHHISVISIFLYNLTLRICVGYSAIALLFEVNSFFLHLRKLMQMHKLKFDNHLYRINAIANLVTFLLCRGTSTFLILYGMTKEYHRFDSFYFFTLSGSMFIMTIINPIFFYLLLKNDFLRHYFKKQPDNRKINQTIKMNNNYYNGNSSTLPDAKTN